MHLYPGTWADQRYRHGGSTLAMGETSYPPIVNGHVKVSTRCQWLHDANMTTFSLKTAVKLFQVTYNLVYNR